MSGGREKQPDYFAINGRRGEGAMIRIQQMDMSFLKDYDKIPMLVHVKSVYQLKKVNRGLGGILLEEVPVM